MIRYLLIVFSFFVPIQGFASGEDKPQTLMELILLSDKHQKEVMLVRNKFEVCLRTKTQVTDASVSVNDSGFELSFTVHNGLNVPIFGLEVVIKSQIKSDFNSLGELSLPLLAPVYEGETTRTTILGKKLNLATPNKFDVEILVRDVFVKEPTAIGGIISKLYWEAINQEDVLNQLDNLLCSAE